MDENKSENRRYRVIFIVYVNAKDKDEAGIKATEYAMLDAKEYLEFVEELLF